MKRIALLLTILAAAAMPVFSFGAGGPGYRRGPRPPTVIQVIAFDGPSWMRTGGPPDRYLCPDPTVTAATATIQEAADAAAAQVALISGVAYKGGVVVELSGGTFKLDKSATAGDEVSGTGDVSKKTAPLNGTLTTGQASVLIQTYDSTWDIDDIAVGQIYDLRGGTGDSTTNTMDVDYERFVGMCGGVTDVAANTGLTYDGTLTLGKTGLGSGVSAGDFLYIESGTGLTAAGWFEVTSATANAIVLTADAGDADGGAADWVLSDAFSVYGNMHATETYALAVFTRVPAAIYMKKGVHLRGAGSTNASLLLLNDAQDCAVIQMEPDLLGGFVQRGFKISDLTINGNKANQTAAATSHGIVTSYNSQTVTIDNVQVSGCLGDGGWFSVAEFVRISDSSFHANGDSDEGNGLGIGGGGPAYIRDCALFGNEGPGLVLHRTSSESVVVRGCNIRTAGDVWAAVSKGTTCARFTGNFFGPASDAGSGELGGLFFTSDSTNGVISGNYFQNQYGNAINARGYFWAITGNHFRASPAETQPYAIHSSQWNVNTVTGNVGIRLADEQVVVRAINTSGGALTEKMVVIREAGATVNSTVKASSRSDEVIGVVWNQFVSPADDEWYSLAIGGRMKALVDDLDDLSIGDPLCASGAVGDEGELTLADTAGDLVVAIVEEDAVPATPWNGTAVATKVSFLLPKDQYVIPGTQMSIVEGLLGDAKAFWPCLEETGSTVSDLTSTHDLTSSEAVSAFDAVPSFTGSKLVYNLNGTDEEFDAADHADFTFGDGTDDSPFSVGAWVYITDTAARRVIIAKCNEDTDALAREWILEIDASDKLTVRLYDESADAYMGTVSNAAPSAAGWHFVVATYTGVAEAVTELNLYVDGVLVASTDADDQGGTYVAMEDMACLPSIGSVFGTDATPTPSHFFNGKMVMPFVTGTELSAPTIARLYALTREFLNQ